MKRLLSSLFFLSVIASSLFLVRGPVSALEYEVVDITPAGFDYASVLDLNVQGQVLGVGRQGDHFYNFLWQDGQSQILGTAEGLEGWNAVNDNGDMLGSWLYSYDCANCGGYSGARQTIGYGTLSSGIHLSGTLMCYLDGPYCRNAYGTPWDLNNGNTVVGVGTFLENEDPVTRAYVWNGSVQNLGVLSEDDESGATAINDIGLVVGWSKNNTTGLYTAVTWAGGLIEPLSRLFEGYPTRAWGVNADNVVIGEAATPSSSSNWQAVLWDDGGIRNLGIEGIAKGINDHGDIVIEGQSGSAYLWEDDSLYNLLGLLPPDHGFPDNRFYPRRINNDGVITGNAGTGESMRAVVLLPVQDTYVLSGHVREDGSPLPNVTIRLDSGQNTQTDATGYYEIELVEGTYTLTPEQEGLRFTPDQHIVTVPPAATGNDFIADEDPPPDKIELQVEFLPNMSGFSVYWDAPGEDGDSGGPASEYDLRYSSTPIDEASWNSCSQIAEEPIPAEPGTEQRMYFDNFALHTKWYFAIKTADAQGNWSEISPFRLVVDSGFRPQVDGYAFRNGESFRKATKDDLRYHCSEQAVCRGTGPDCIAYSWVNPMLIYINSVIKGGLCNGMSVTSLRFFHGMDDIQALNPLANMTYDFVPDDVCDPILHYQIVQYFDPIDDYFREDWVGQDAFLGQLLSEMTTTQPVEIGLRLSFGKHAVIPIALTGFEGRSHRILVYDSNRPSSFTDLEIDTTAGLWGYYRMAPGQYKYYGNAQGLNFKVIPISVFPPPFSGTSECKIPDEIRVTLKRIADYEDVLAPFYLAIADLQGQQTGYVEGQIINEIPGATVTMIPHSLDQTIEPIYDLPLQGEYVISVNGEGLVEPDTVGVTQFGPDYTAWIDNLVVVDETRDTLEVTQEGRHLVFTSTTPQEMQLGLALDLTENSYTFQITDADTGPGETVLLEVIESSGRILFHNSQNINGSYSLLVERANSLGRESFSYANLSISAMEAHEFDYENWDGMGPMTQFIDYGGDGTTDATKSLINGGSPEDLDGDTVLNELDNCPLTSNVSQLDTDADNLGNACDPCAFDSDSDHDIDGSDLADLAVKLYGDSMSDFVLEFGETNCLD